MEILSALNRFHLNSNESNVYIALLKLGATTVGPIGGKTKLHRQGVYEVLTRLERMKLVTSVIKNNRRYYRAVDPGHFLDEANQLVSTARELVGKLEKIRTQGNGDLEVYTGRGKAEYFKHLLAFVRSAQKHDGIIRIMGGADDAIPYQILGSLYEEYRKELISSRVKKYLVAAEEHSSVFKKQFALEPNTILKTIASSLVSPTFTRLTHDLMGIEVFSDDVLVIRIQNASIAQAYQNHFNILWKQGILYKPEKNWKPS